MEHFKSEPTLIQLTKNSQPIENQLKNSKAYQTTLPRFPKTINQQAKTKTKSSVGKPKVQYANQNKKNKQMKF